MAYLRPVEFNNDWWALRATDPPTDGSLIDLGLTNGGYLLGIAVYDSRDFSVDGEFDYRAGVETTGTGGVAPAHVAIKCTGAGGVEAGNFYDDNADVGPSVVDVYTPHFVAPDAVARTGGGYVYPAGAQFSFPQHVASSGTVTVMEVFERVPGSQPPPPPAGRKVLMVV